MRKNGAGNGRKKGRMCGIVIKFPKKKELLYTTLLTPDGHSESVCMVSEFLLAAPNIMQGAGGKGKPKLSLSWRSRSLCCVTQDK